MSNLIKAKNGDDGFHIYGGLGVKIKIKLPFWTLSRVVLCRVVSC